MTERLSADELKKMVSLRDVAAGVVKLEKRNNEYWGCCPFHSEKTSSFAIKIKDGCEIFFCLGCGKGGSVVDFIMLHEGLDQKGAFKRLHELAGDTEWKEAAKKVQESFQAVGEPDKIVFQLSAYEAKEKALLSNPAALQFLNETRGITTETAKAVHFGYAQSATGHIKPEDEDARDKGWICMPRVIGNTVIAVKMRSIFKKVFVQIAHMNPKALFNTDTINALEPVFVTEGEFDSAVMEQAGFRAVSIPNASTKITPEWKEQLM